MVYPIEQPLAGIAMGDIGLSLVIRGNLGLIGARVGKFEPTLLASYNMKILLAYGVVTARQESIILGMLANRAGFDIFERSGSHRTSIL
jgi:hypothetical protein